MADRVAVVHRLVGAEVHDHRLGADRERAGEHVEAVDRRLQVHQPLAGLVVGAVQLVRVADVADADPLAAVVGLHEQRVADLLRDRVEVERPVVLGRRVGEARVVGRVLVRDQDRLRHLQPEPQHRAVGRVLLHRLERERAVEQVHVVHQRDLLEPLARQVVPVGEPVDDEVVARLVAQVERLHRDPLGGRRGAWRRSASSTGPSRAIERLEGGRPVLLGAEQQPDQVIGLVHGPPSAEPWQMVGELRSPGGPVVRHVVAPEVQLAADPLLAEQAGERPGAVAARRSCPPTCPARTRAGRSAASAASRGGRRPRARASRTGC